MYINIYNITCTGTLVSATSQAAVNNHRNKVKNSHWLATIAYFQTFDSNGHHWSTIDKHCEQVHEHVTRRTVLWRDMKPWQRSLQYKGSKSVPTLVQGKHPCWQTRNLWLVCTASLSNMFHYFEAAERHKICQILQHTHARKHARTQARMQARKHARTHGSTHARTSAHTETDRHPPTHPQKQLISSTIPSKMPKMPAYLGYRYNNCTRSPNTLNLET